MKSIFCNFNIRLVSSSQTVNLVSFYFIFIFHFYFLVFLFLEHRVRVKSQDAKNEVERSRINDVIQHGHHMLVLCTIYGCLG